MTAGPRLACHKKEVEKNSFSRLDKKLKIVSCSFEFKFVVRWDLGGDAIQKKIKMCY